MALPFICEMWGLLLSIAALAGVSPVPYTANILGTTDAAIKLLLSILMGYPLAILYEKYFKNSNVNKNVFFILTGVDIAFFNFGTSMYHNLVPVIIFYLTTMIFHGGKINALITFVVNMTYLLVGYYKTESENYDITWTMPHCVLALKLIALSFDLWDGEKKKQGKILSENCQKTALEKEPTLLQLIGFIYFPAAFLVGPIFSFKRYVDFVENKFPTDKIKCQSDALKRLLQGILYLAAFQVGVSVYNINYMSSEEFWERSIFYRHIYCGLWAHFALYKYISCWLLTEASCIRFGLSYNGMEKTADGQAITKWDGCNNIKLLRFETATKFGHYIESFNCNTNHFAAEYIYKRLKFLGNRNLSQFFTLLFLALWHGLQSGYYMTFFNEFIIIFMEKQLESILTKTKFYEAMWNNTTTKVALYAVLKIYTIVFMGWSLVPFDFKVFSKWWPIYSSLYFSGFILFLPWGFLYKPQLIKALKATNMMKSKDA